MWSGFQKNDLIIKEKKGTLFGTTQLLITN